MSVRRAWRAVALGATLTACLFRYWLACLSEPLSYVDRARWLQDSCRRVLDRMGICLQVVGQPSGQGIIVSNHLSYLDIAVLGAVAPVCFVSKAEVQRWPLFGTVARAGGTIFLDRSSLASAERVAAQMAARMEERVPVMLFPEGTTTDGSSVLRFHSLLFEPAVRAGLSVTAAAVHYLPPHGCEEQDVCWFGDEGFLPHLWKLLGVRGLTAEIQFAPPRVYLDRRTAAAQTHAEVAAMRRAIGKPALGFGVGGSCGGNALRRGQDGGQYKWI